LCYVVVGSSFNAPRNLLISFAKGRRYTTAIAKPLDFVIGGLQLNSTYSWMAGQPFT